MSLRARISFALMAALVIAAFTSLGLWQRERASQKASTLRQSERVISERSPQSLDAVSSSPSPALAWLRVEGGFSTLPPMLLDNQMREGRAGVRVFRVFLVEPDESPLLVDLGWLPLPATREMPELVYPAGRWTLEGLLAPPPAAGLTMGAGMVRSDGAWLLTRFDTDMITQAIGLSEPLPRNVLRLDPALALGYERDLDMLPNSLPPERHLGYSVQWFALAAAVLVVYLALTWRSLRPRSSR